MRSESGSWEEDGSGRLRASASSCFALLSCVRVPEERQHGRQGQRAGGRAQSDGLGWQGARNARRTGCYWRRSSGTSREPVNRSISAALA
nr:hypothetical protein CFP56_02553 [Quercus suber]